MYSKLLGIQFPNFPSGPMPPPTNIHELLDRVRRSGVVPPERLDVLLATLEASARPPTTPSEMLKWLMDAGMITRFHADKFIVGKYKGFHVGRYLILDQLGCGGMGQVYLAEHLNMRRLVALKVLSPHAFEHDAVARERFFREARAAGTLDHPNIVRVFDLCQEGKLLYLVMEYVEGLSLQEMIARAGPLDVTTACHYARQIAFGLQHAYELGFVHRDIKPGNVLVDRIGVVRILDFGLVRSESETGDNLTRQLGDRAVLGTADYMAPEQASDSSGADIRADIYSLGATLYHMLAGRPLFPEGRTAQKLVWQQIKEPVPIDRLRPEVPAQLAEFVHAMLMKRPGDRPQTPAEVFVALEPFVGSEVPSPNPAWLPAPAARVVAVRSPAPELAAPRVSGSTSQIFAAAMNSGSGSLSSSATRRSPTATPSANSVETDRLALGSERMPNGPDTASTGSLRATDTQTNTIPHLPQHDHDAEPKGKRLVLPDQAVVISTLSIALLISLVGIIILLLRG